MLYSTQRIVGATTNKRLSPVIARGRISNGGDLDSGFFKAGTGIPRSCHDSGHRAMLLCCSRRRCISPPPCILMRRRRGGKKEKGHAAKKRKMKRRKPGRMSTPPAAYNQTSHRRTCYSRASTVQAIAGARFFVFPRNPTKFKENETTPQTQNRTRSRHHERWISSPATAHCYRAPLHTIYPGLDLTRTHPDLPEFEPKFDSRLHPACLRPSVHLAHPPFTNQLCPTPTPTPSSSLASIIKFEQLIVEATPNSRCNDADGEGEEGEGILVILRVKKIGGKFFCHMG